MVGPEIDNLLPKAGSKYILIIAAARRAREINNYFNALQRQEASPVASPQIEIEAITNKPLSIAFEEIARDKLVFEHTKNKTK